MRPNTVEATTDKVDTIEATTKLEVQEELILEDHIMELIDQHQKEVEEVVENLVEVDMEEVKKVPK